jgi:uncharacterized protein YndB with AHSA1/START domain
MSNNNAT